MGYAEIKLQLNEVKSQLADFSKELLPAVEQQRKDLKAYGEVSQAVADTLKAHGDTVGQLTIQMGDLQRLIADIEAGQSAAAKGRKGDEQKSLVQRLVESAGYKEWSEGARIMKTSICEVGAFWDRKRSRYEQKDSVAVDASGIVMPFFDRPPSMIAQPRALMRSLCRVVPTTETNLVKAGKETVNNKLITKLTAAVSSGNAVFPVIDDVSGFATQAPFNIITLNNGTTTEVLTIQSIDVAAKTITTTTSSSINMAKDDTITAPMFTYNNKGMIVPRANKKFEDVDVKIVDIDAQMTATLNELRDVPLLEAIIRDNLLSDLGQAEDVNSFYAEGDMIGVFSDSDVSQLTWSAQPPGTNILDFILDGYYAIAGDNYFADATLVELSVHKRLIKMKASDGHYIFWTQFTEGAPPAVFATRLMWSNLLLPNDGLIAEFPRACSFYDREQGTVEIGTVNEQFTRKERTLLASERLGFRTLRPQAIRRLKFDGPPVAP